MGRKITVTLAASIKDAHEIASKVEKTLILGKTKNESEHIMINSKEIYENKILFLLSKLFE